MGIYLRLLLLTALIVAECIVLSMAGAQSRLETPNPSW